MRHGWWIAVVIGGLLAGSPTRADERADIEAACVKLGLGPLACTCIAENTMSRFDARMREVIHLSLRDEVEFKIMVQAGHVTREEVETLDAFQVEIEPLCKIGH